MTIWSPLDNFIDCRLNESTLLQENFEVNCKNFYFKIVYLRYNIITIKLLVSCFGKKQVALLIWSIRHRRVQFWKGSLHNWECNWSWDTRAGRRAIGVRRWLPLAAQSVRRDDCQPLVSHNNYQLTAEPWNQLNPLLLLLMDLFSKRSSPTADSYPLQLDNGLFVRGQLSNGIILAGPASDCIFIF